MIPYPKDTRPGRDSVSGSRTVPIVRMFDRIEDSDLRPFVDRHNAFSIRLSNLPNRCLLASRFRSVFRGSNATRRRSASSGSPTRTCPSPSAASPISGWMASSSATSTSSDRSRSAQREKATAGSPGPESNLFGASAPLGISWTATQRGRGPRLQVAKTLLPTVSALWLTPIPLTLSLLSVRSIDVYPPTVTRDAALGCSSSSIRQGSIRREARGVRDLDRDAAGRAGISGPVRPNDRSAAGPESGHLCQ